MATKETYTINLPITAGSMIQCPHGDKYLMHFTGNGQYNFWCCFRCSAAMQDWHRLSKDEYYEKYPELKPPKDSTHNRVILDEADKMPGPKCK